MRDLLNLIDNFMTEANLASNEIPANKLSGVKNPINGKPFTRPELFLYKVKNKLPFTTTSGESVTIDPQEAEKVRRWVTSGPVGTISLKTTNGDFVKNTQLQKTVEFGSKEAEMIKIKGSDVFGSEDTDVKDLGNSIESIMTAGGFLAIDMYDKIAKSPQMKNLGRVGQAVISMARQITQGKVPTFPADLKPEEIKAIELYASEYLGVLALVAGTVQFKQGSRAAFDEFLGTDLGSMVMYFPKSVSNPLADSFSIVNDATGHAIKISSKAAGKGAPPSLTSMKLSNNVREKYPEAAAFLDVAQDPQLSTFTQPFAMMNALQEIAPESVPKQYAKLMLFNDEDVAAYAASAKTGQPLPARIMKIFNSRLSDQVQASSATDGGKAWYAVTTDIMRIVNSGSAVKDLRPALIESLGYNFVQLYSSVRGNQLVTEAFWPAKINGQVRLKTKGSAADPGKGKLSVEISPGKDQNESIESALLPTSEPKKLGTETALGRRRQRQ
jgi:hypothetical protein